MDMKRCSSLVMMEKQTKTIMKYNLAPTRMAVVKKKKRKENNKGWGGCEEIGTLLYCWWGSKIV